MRSMRISRTVLVHGARCAALALLTLALPAMAQAQGGGTLAQVRARGAINLGYLPNAKPMSFRDAAGNADGYAIALCKAVAEAVKAQLAMPGLAVQFVPLTDADPGRSLQSGRVDMICVPVEETLARRATMNFSLPVFLGGSGLLIRRDAPATFRNVLEGRDVRAQPLWRGSPQLALLAKRTFVVVPGTASERWLRTRARELKVNSNIVTAPTLASGLEKVRSGEADAFLAERSVLLDLARNDNDVMVLDRVVAPSTHALVLRRNDDDFRLLVDRVLSGLYRSGKIDALYTQYLGNEKAGTREWFRQAALPDG